MREEGAARARREIAHLAHSGLDWITFATRVEGALGNVVSFGPSCWHTLDPATLIFTGGVAKDLGEEPRLPYHEYAIPDVNKWAYLAKLRRSVGVLSRATHGKPESSPRYRALLAPRGLEHELRGTFTADDAAWGCFTLYRERGRADFEEQEEDLVAGLTTMIADGLRRALLLSAAMPQEATPDGPGVVVFDDAGEIEAVSPAGERWMSELCDNAAVGRPSVFPYTVHAVALRARLAGNEEFPERSARARASTRSGRWLTLYGTRLSTPAGERVAVIIEPARPAEIAPIIVRAYGLSERERDIAGLCLQGASTAEIAERLHISPHTVQDHLKSIFFKTGVRSRRDLVAKIVNQHYWPRFGPVDADERDGWMAMQMEPLA